jgi:flagellar hook protein FlgE
MSFQQGLSGLNVSAKALDVVGNNIANSNTVGFKSARAEFADVFAASLTGAGASQVGAGAQVGAIAQQFTQGIVTTTNSPLDIAINGGGFFRMSNDGAISFTRNGQFKLDKEGFIVNSAGSRLQGYAPDPTSGTIVPSTPEDIYIDPSDLQPSATAKLATGVNIDSREPVPPNAAFFNTTDPDSYNASTSVTLYDTLGNPHIMTMYFTKQEIGAPPTATTQWQVRASVDGTSENLVDLGQGFGAPAIMVFDTNGKLNAGTGINGGPSAVPIAASIDLSAVLAAQTPPVANGAATPLPFQFDLASVTQFGSPFSVNKMDQDGFSSGRLAGLNVSPDGVILGRYSNGESRNMAQVVLARFNNPNGLLSMGGNQWQETSASGQPLIGAPGTGSNGVLQSASVEEANVDLTAELVNMITLQRAYQANAQTIKTQDSILNTLVNLR